ncbi:hypothetical protein KHA93_16950 [Bacillus sp. FJAT-49732]|uniref:Regulatory protein YycH domain-containing protein n=1 Tax=Lederbergia citrisecunda TaxID=2833583 RepID=A0A942TR08_9BACI|nr:hypothetical protein [Lederbergia citrisecunda]
MKYETVKSIVLTVLVAFSALLTWNLWTYQPKYEFPNNKYVHEISIADTRDVSQLIKPLQVLYHIDDGHYGTVLEEDINNLLKEMSKWNFYNIGSARILEPYQIEQRTTANNTIDIIYPGVVPFELYKGVLHFEADVLPNASFDRIVINLDKNTKSSATVSFISTNEGRVYDSNVNPDKVASLLIESKRKKNVFDEYKAFELRGQDGPNRTIYLPIEEQEVEWFKYRIEYTNPDKFKNALFRDPKKVRRDDILPNEEQYTDDRSVMNVDSSTNIIDYINPGQETVTGTPSINSNVLKRSIDFVNEHGGWTDNYRYFDMSVFEKKTVFQLFLQNYPVFNEQGMANILQLWSNEEIFQYKRPYFSKQLEIPPRKTKVLPSGESVLNSLLKEPDFKPDMLESILVGYRLSKDSENTEIIDLKPSWYYLYGGSWIRFDQDEKRGDMGGLE